MNALVQRTTMDRVQTSDSVSQSYSYGVAVCIDGIITKRIRRRYPPVFPWTRRKVFHPRGWSEKPVIS